MALPQIIQGGMGASISTWRLARAVSAMGHLGVVSGTGIGGVFLRRLAARDEATVEALRRFPDQACAAALIEKHKAPPGTDPEAFFRLPEMWSLRASPERDRITVAGAFVEVSLAKHGHDGQIGINVLEKASLPNLATLYGAMLAGVDWVLMGAGIPLRIPGALDALALHGTATYPIHVDGASAEDDFRMTFDPMTTFPGIERQGPLRRPKFVPVIASHVLAQALVKRSDGRIDGFVVETKTAGGHNAPPRGKLVLDELGEPVYGPRDEADLEALKKLGLPFWMAGGYGTPDGLKRALALGAAGVQVGTAFAYCAESGMEPSLRRRIQREAYAHRVRVKTDARASPTGFPFKIVSVEGSVSDPAVRDARLRVCNLGILRQPYKRDDGAVGFRCPAEPVEQFVQKGGSAEDTVDRVCLCNGLMATAGFALKQKNGVVEPPLVTSGDDVANLARYLPTKADDSPMSDDYTAADVVDYLLGAP